MTKVPPCLFTQMATLSKLKPTDSVFIDNNLEQRKEYECPVCSYLLRDAVQINCGHRLCSECAKQLFTISTPTCPRTECGETLERQHFPDKFVRKQINKFLVRCRYYRNKCEWTGPLIEQLKHIETCIYEQEECEYCHEDFDKSELKAHERNCPKALMTCPFVEYGCEITKQMTRAECDKHLEAEVATHLRIVVPVLGKLSANKKDMEKLIKDKSFPGQSAFRGNVEMDGAGATRSGQMYNPEMDSFKKRLASQDSQIRHLQDKLLQVEATVLAKTTENEHAACYDFDKSATSSSLSEYNDVIFQHIGTQETTISDDDIAKHQPTTDEIRRLFYPRNSNIVCLSPVHRLSLMENSNYDGTMLWKIPQFTQRMDDARTGKYTSIFSLPFYSGRYGYKMCLRLYILGDGIGKGSHMSLFFVLMKGEFDNILQWPFNHKVTFKLLNQCSGRDVVDLFQPDPLSSSFRKPKTDMNIASGCPRFVSLTELMQNGFIVDDTVLIKVKVDISSMKHP